MGLDLVVEARAKTGHEVEWRDIISRAFADKPLSEAEMARFQEISSPAYENLGAPRVGFDPAADAWMIEARGAEGPEEIAKVLAEFHGYHVVDLVESDGVPLWSHGHLYGDLDVTSLRGKALESATAILPKPLIHQAYEHRLPEAAIAYGAALLAAAERARLEGPLEPRKRGLFAFLSLPRGEALSFEEQLELVEDSGRWFIFWGERGHAIRAWV